MSFNFYFSGIASKVEADCLRAAGVRHVLVDPADLPHAAGFGRIALDSGAYRSWKTGKCVDIEAYKALARSAQFAWHVVPVWQYGAPKELLTSYLEEASLVAIGGLVSLMREKNETMFKDIAALYQRYPRRLHLLGANWVRVLNELRHVAASMDTSKWLDAARYAVCFFIHARTRKLHVAPAAAIDLGHLSRDERLVTSARVIDEYLNGTHSRRLPSCAACQQTQGPLGRRAQPARRCPQALWITRCRRGVPFPDSRASKPAGV